MGGPALGLNHPSSEAAVTPIASVAEAVAVPIAIATRREDGAEADIVSSRHERRKSDESDDFEVQALPSWLWRRARR
jgi:hypothetical protein